MGVSPPQSLDQLQAIAFRHVDIRDDEVTGFLSEGSDPVTTIPHFANTVPRGLKADSKDFTEGRIVINDENGSHVSLSSVTCLVSLIMLPPKIVTPAYEVR